MHIAKIMMAHDRPADEIFSNYFLATVTDARVKLLIFNQYILDSV